MLKLEGIIMEVFNDYAYYYNIIYQDKDYKTEALQIDSLFNQYGKDIETVIDYGCGTGRHDIELSRLGYRCTGVDMSPLMIEIAKANVKEAFKVNFEVADIRNYIPKRKYDAVISLFHVMSYQNTNDDMLSVVRTARSALDIGGIFLFDVWYGPGVLSDKPTVRVKEIEDEKNRIVRVARPRMHDKRNIVDVCYEIFVIEKETGNTKEVNEIHNMRYFFRPEIELFLQRSGFRLIDNIDCKTLRETDYSSWTSYFIAVAV